MLADAPERRTQRGELKIRVSPVRFRPWPLTTKNRLAKPDASWLLEPPVAQSDDLIERGVAVPARLDALNEPPRHAVVASPAQLRQRQPLVSRLFERRDVGGIDAVIARLYELFGVRGRVAQLLHIRDV